MRKPCQHGIVLQKGLRCNHGYLEIILCVSSRLYCRTFGLHTRDSEAIGVIHLAEKKKEIMMGKFGFTLPLPRKRFKEVSNVWFEIWKNERLPDGKQAHSEKSQYDTLKILESTLVPEFGDNYFDEIKPIDVERWREKGLSRGLTGTSLNRYQATLSSIFSHIERWIKTERIKPAFKIPEENPCTPVEKSSTIKRDRLLSEYELKKLKLTCYTLNDTDAWEICKFALKTMLSRKDLKNLEIGQEIDIDRAKTGVPVNIPLPVLVKLNWKNWDNRWPKIQKASGISDFQFRDLRKTGLNRLKGKYDLKLISEYAGHADIKTTEKAYTIKQGEKLVPLAQELDKWAENL